MHTKDRLAAALREIKLDKMAQRAAEGYYDDFLSPLALPITTLATELINAGTPEAMALRERVVMGEFDATLEEANEQR